jgi:hypothetical protein
VLAQILVDAGPVVAHHDHERQVHHLVGAGDSQPHAVLVARGQSDLAHFDGGVGQRLGGILDQVQQHLDELIAVAMHRRQRRIVGFDEAQMRREPCLRQPPDVFQHPMDVHRAALDRLVTEYLHAVDQSADAVGFVADQHREFTVGVADRGFEQLRRAADAGQRVLDLVGKDRRHAGNAAGGAAEGELAIERARGGGIGEGEQHAARLLRQGCALRGDAVAAQPWAADRQIMVGHRDLAAADLLQQQKQRVVRRDDILQRQHGELCHRDPEELLGGVVGVAELIMRIDHQDRHRQRAEQHGGIRRLGTQRRARALRPADHRQHPPGHRASHAASSSVVSSRTGSGGRTPRAISGS